MLQELVSLLDEPAPKVALFALETLQNLVTLPRAPSATGEGLPMMDKKLCKVIGEDPKVS